MGVQQIFLKRSSYHFTAQLNDHALTLKGGKIFNSSLFNARVKTTEDAVAKKNVVRPLETFLHNAH